MAIVLSAETKQKLDDHFQRHWKNRSCPVCRSDAWYVQPGGLIRPVQEISVDGRVGFVETERTVPTIQAICKTCFYAHSFLLMPILGEEAADV